jgi:hypothetical protein
MTLATVVVCACVRRAGVRVWNWEWRIEDAEEDQRDKAKVKR